MMTTTTKRSTAPAKSMNIKWAGVAATESRVIRSTRLLWQSLMAGRHDAILRPCHGRKSENWRDSVTTNTKVSHVSRPNQEEHGSVNCNYTFTHKNQKSQTSLTFYGRIIVCRLQLLQPLDETEEVAYGDKDKNSRYFLLIKFYNSHHYGSRFVIKHF